jgi:hypothetical protein
MRRKFGGWIGEQLGVGWADEWGMVRGVIVFAVVGWAAGCEPGAVVARKGGAGGKVGGGAGDFPSVAVGGGGEGLGGRGGRGGRIGDAGVADVDEVLVEDGGTGDVGRGGGLAGRGGMVARGKEGQGGRGVAGLGGGKGRADGGRDGGGIDAGAKTAAGGASGRVPKVGDLIVDEALVNPGGDDLGREWVEIASVSGDPLDLSGLHLASATTDVGVAAGTLAPGGLMVLGQSADATKNGGARVDAAYGTKLILSNANGQLSICVDACAFGTVLEKVAWGTLPDTDAGHALVFDRAGQLACTSAAAFGAGGDFGSPGEPNPPCGAAAADSGASGDGSVAH